MKSTQYSILLMCFVCFYARGQENYRIPIYEVCDNGGFESGYINYSFLFDDYNQIDRDCSISTSSIPAYTGAAVTYNSFTNPVTLVDGDISISNGNDPTLAGYGVNIPRVLQGEYAIKLNAEDNNEGITVMSKLFYAVDPIVSYNFSIVAGNHTFSGTADEPFFIVRLYDSFNNVIAENCIDIGPVNPIFNTTSGNEFIYTGWLCDELSTAEAAENERLRLEFIITDDAKGASFASVYIDDICNDFCCRECPDIEIDVPSNSSDHQDASECIHAYNTVNSGAIAEYHAGYEVVLLPGEPDDATAVPGFESLYGSDGYYHIAGCDEASEDEAQRKNMSGLQNTKDPLKIFPNPANNELYVISEIDINSLSLISLDGKTIMVKQKEKIDNKSYKLDLTGISQGVYILTVETTNGSVTSQKIIKE